MVEANITLAKIAYNVSHTLGILYDEYLLEKIKMDAIAMRALLIRRDLDRNGISREFLQSLGCIPLVCADPKECCDLPAEYELLRTDRKVPKPARTKDSDSFYFVGTVDNRKSFYEIPFELTGFINANKYTKNLTHYYYKSDYVYIINPPSDTFKYINITSIFADPRQIVDFQSCQGDCYTDDSAFPLSEDLLPLLTSELIKQYSAYQRPVEDKEVKINNN